MEYRKTTIELPLVRESSKERIRTPEDVCRICADMRDLAQESFQVLLLNSRNFLIARHMVSLGIADASLVHPREVLRPAITEGASATVLAHNHPSGDVTPSAEDVRITRQLIQAGKIVDIKILDHIIIGNLPPSGNGGGSSRSFLSMREEGFCDFS